jgi:hypothetical protein
MTGRLGESRAGVLGRPLAWREGAVGDRIAPTSNTAADETQCVPSVVQHGAQITGEWSDSEYAARAET